MLFHRTFDNLLDSTSKIVLLRYLILTEETQSGRALGRLTDIHQTKCSSALRELLATGILTMSPQGRSNLYSVNVNSYMYLPLLQLFQAEKNFTQQLAKMIIEKLTAKIDSIYLFGSAARQEDTEDSDIDILIISDESVADSEIESVISRCFQASGRQLSLVFYTAKNLRKKWKTKDQFILNVLRDGKKLYGKSKGDLLIGTKKK